MSSENEAKPVENVEEVKPVEEKPVDDSEAKVVRSNKVSIEDDKELNELPEPQPIEKPRKKRVISDKQREALQRGREKAKEKQKERMKKIKEYEAKEAEDEKRKIEEMKKLQKEEPTERKIRKTRKPRACIQEEEPKPRKPRIRKLKQEEPPPPPRPQPIYIEFR